MTYSLLDRRPELNRITDNQTPFVEHRKHTNHAAIVALPYQHLILRYAHIGIRLTVGAVEEIEIVRGVRTGQGKAMLFTFACQPGLLRIQVK